MTGFWAARLGIPLDWDGGSDRKKVMRYLMPLLVTVMRTIS